MRKWVLILIITTLIGALSCFVAGYRETLSLTNLKSPLSDVFSASGAESGIGEKIPQAAKTIFENTWDDFQSIYNFFSKRDFYFNKISFATADKNSNIYVIDSSLQRIAKINSKREVEFFFNADRAKEALNSGGRNYDENVFSAAEIAVDNNSHLYVLYRILEPYGLNVISEVVVQYSDDGGEDKLVFQNSYEKGKSIAAGRLRSLQYGEGFLYVIGVDASSNNATVYKINTNDFRNVNSELKFSLPAGVNLLDISGNSLGGIFFSTMNSDIYRVTGYNKQEIIFAASREDDLQFPWHLTSLSNESIYYADVIKREIFKFNLREGSRNRQLVFSGKNYPDMRVVKYNNVYVGQDGTTIASLLVDKKDDPDCNSAIAVIGSDGKSFLVYKAEYSQGNLVLRWGLLVAMLAILVLLFLGGRIVYVYFMKRRVSLFLKQVFVFVPLLVIMLTMIAWIAYSGFASKYEKEVDQKLMLLAHACSGAVDGDTFSRISKPDHFMKKDYQTVRSQIHSLFEEKQGTVSESNLYEKIAGGMYIALYKVDKQDNIYSAMYFDDTSFFTPIEVTGEEYRQYLSVYKRGSLEKNTSRDSDGYWRYAIGPLHNSRGEIVGICEAGMNMSGFDDSMSQIRIQLVEAVSSVTALFIVAFFFMTYYQLKSLRILRDSVNEIACGNFETQADIKSNDEVADLSKGFNSMSSHIRGYIMKLTTLSEAYYRFVPQQFLNFLGKESILDVQLGDHEEMSMSVLLTNIRSFSVMSQSMTPEENFNFINSFLSQIGPTVRENNGFIDKYLGGGVMALFADAPEDSVKSAINMRKRLDEYNSGRKKAGYKSIEIGIGIHTGKLMLGVIGEEKRLEGTVISDNVNLSLILEVLTDRFGAPIIISDDTYKSISKPVKYHNRTLGLIRVEGKNDPIRIYDVFEGDHDIDRKLKQKTKKAFEEGIEFYQCGRFYDARGKFVEVIKENRADKAAKIYFLLCDEYARTGSPEGWDGTLNAEEI